MPKCCKCHAELSPERLEGLQVLGKPEQIWDCISCAPNQKVRGIYNGFSGVAPLVIVSDVGTDKPIWHETEPDNLKDFSYSLSDEE